MEGSAVDALEFRDTGDLGTRTPDAWLNGAVCNVDWLDVSSVTRPSSFCSNWATRLDRRSVARRDGKGGVGTYVGFDVRVRLRIGRSCKKHSFFSR